MSVSHWILERNRDVAGAVFGPAGDGPSSSRQSCADERKAAGLTPFIVAGAAAAALGGRFGLDGKMRAAAGGIAALLFLAI